MKKKLSIILTTVLFVSMLFTPMTAFSADIGTAGTTQGASGVAQDVNVEGTNAAGNLIAQEITAKDSEQKDNNGCNIFSVEMNGKNAFVNFETSKDCTLLIAIYDEEGKQMIASGKKKVKKEDTEATVIIDTSNMPKYFFLRAFLIGTKDLEPLCTTYESPNYTKEMTKFFDKTVEDFDSEKVVNFDADKKNNFAVYNEKIKTIEPTDGKNIVTKENNVKKQYIIKKIDKQVSSLKAGDIFAYEYENGKLLIVKVKSIKVSGTTALIEGEETTLTEVFDYVKIDTQSGIEDAEIVKKTKEEGIIDNGLVEFNEQRFSDELMRAQGDEEGKIIKVISKNIEKSLYSDDHSMVKLSGELNLRLDTTVKVYATLTYQYVELKFDTVIGTILTASGSVNYNFDLDSFKYVPIPCVEISVTPEITFQFSGKIEFEGIIKATAGGTYDSHSGYRTLTGNPTSNNGLKAEGRIYVGIGLVPAVNVIHKNVLSIFLDGEAGIEVVAVRDLYNSSTSTTERHTCKLCIDGDVNFKAKIMFGVELLNKPIVDASLYDESYHLVDFYYSESYHKFGWGKCPYVLYEVTITVIDEAGMPVTGVSVNGIVTDEQGRVAILLASGLQTIKVEKDGYQRIEQNLVVEKNTQNLQICLKKGGTIGSPGEIIVPSEASIQAASLGNWHSAAITTEGTLYTWGDNRDGQLGNGTGSTSNSVPQKILEHVKMVSLKGGRSAAVMEDGTLFMWGKNLFGAFGNGTADQGSLTPKKIMDEIQTVSLGNYHSAAITEDGCLYIWGQGTNGRLGDGTDRGTVTPKKIMENISSVSLGGHHSAAITKDGTLYMWGYNGYGQIGDGTREDALTPVKIMENVESVSLGDCHSAAITQDGSLFVWGEGADGRLGNGQEKDSLVPEKIMENVQQVDLGRLHSAAITMDGGLYLWGSNYCGQLGDGTKEGSLIPKKILEDVKLVSLGDDQSAAVTKDGYLYEWGDTRGGELFGNSTLLPRKITISASSGDPISMVDTSVHSDDKVVISLSDVSFDATSVFYTSESMLKTTQVKEFSELQPGTLHNFYVMKERNCEDPLSADNLLYIDQGTSNLNGIASFRYVINEDYSNADSFVVGMPAYDISFCKSTLKKINYSYTGKSVKPLPQIVINGKTLKKNRDYKVSYYNNKKIGTAKIIVRGKGEYSGKKTIIFKIVPKKTTISSIKSLTKKSMQLKWKKVSQASGYQIRYSRSSKFTSPKSIKVKGAARTSYNVKKLTSKKKYYVKVRAYKVVNGKTYYGSWSKIRSATVK